MEAMECEGETSWMMVRKKWKGVIQDSVFNQCFETSYDSLVEMKWGLKRVLEDEDEEGIRVLSDEDKAEGRLVVLSGLMKVGAD